MNKTLAQLAANVPVERKLIETIELDHHIHALKLSEALQANRPVSIFGFSFGFYRQFTYNF